MEFVCRYEDLLKKAGVVGVVFLGMKYLVPLCLPFLVAALAAWWLRPVFVRMEKWFGLKPTFFAGLLLLVAAAVLGILAYFFGGQLWELGSRFWGRENMTVYVDQVLTSCCRTAEKLLGFPAEKMQKVVTGQIQVLFGNGQGGWMKEAMNGSVTMARGLGKILAGVLVGVISFVLLAGDFEKIKELACGSEVWQKGILAAKGIRDAIGGYVRAQCLIIGLVMGICVAGFCIAGTPYAVLLGMGTGLMDGLPLLGTGLVLLPWLVVELVRGDYTTALILGLTYGACVLTREILEPRLIGKRLGLFPVLVLLSVYVGVKVYGGLGIVTGPLSLLVIRELWKQI